MLYSAPPDTERLRRYANAGIERAVLWLSPKPRDEVERKLDRLAELVAPVA